MATQYPCAVLSLVNSIVEAFLYKWAWLERESGRWQHEFGLGVFAWWLDSCVGLLSGPITQQLHAGREARTFVECTHDISLIIYADSMLCEVIYGAVNHTSSLLAHTLLCIDALLLVAG